MANKSFSIFLQDPPNTVSDGDRLIIEIGKSHAVCMHISHAGHAVMAFELFTFPEAELMSIDRLFTDISTGSQLLNNKFDSVDVFINNEFCVAVPAQKFEESLATDFLHVAHGAMDNMVVMHSKIGPNASLVNVFGVPVNLIKELENRFRHFHVHHTWANILKILDNRNYQHVPCFMYVQFYNTYFVAVVIKNGKLQFIQNFIYDSPEDVLYQLLNITNQLNLDATELQLEVCGIIDANFKLFRELTSYFKNIVSNKPSIANVLINVEEYPGHYFSPFFNLAI